MTIIVLLILAGVSLNAIVGDNGILTQAMNAKKVSEDVDRREQIEMMIMGYVSNVDDNESLTSYLSKRKGKEIDDALQVPDPNGTGGRVNAVVKDGHYYIILEENGNYKVEEMNTDLDNIGGGITLATPDNFDKEKNGTMEFNPGENGKSTLVFSEKIEDEFCFDIKSGEVTIYIDDDMTLTNENVTPKRSAINIEPKAKLNLYIAKDVTLTVNSGFGEKGQTAEGVGAKGGPGGYAGIRVPWIDSDNDGKRDEEEQGELNLHGEGTVIAVGGDAGEGAGAVSGDTGGRRGPDGAGAGIGGNRRQWRRC